MTLRGDACAPTSLLEALTRIRTQAEAHMDHHDRNGLSWSEETVTEIAIGAGLPFVRPIPFNRRQESAVGADWLWWWLDRSSEECFGMLVQAKRIKHECNKWKLDVSHREGKQQLSLIESAEQLEVPAIYGVYTGGMVLRQELGCPHRLATPCSSCIRMAITMMPAFSLSPAWGQDALANLTFTEGVPLEDLGDPLKPTALVKDVNFRGISEGELRDFLTEEQTGPREVAKKIFRSVSTRRVGQKSAVLTRPVEVAGEQVFHDLPGDRGHFPAAYYPHVLGGLRQNPPNYLRDIMAGFEPPAEIARLSAGVVLITS